MSIFSTTKAERIAFFRSHIAQWTTNASAIGVQAADVTALDALVASAEQDFADQQLKQQAAQNAVGICTNSVRAMTKKGMELMKQIRAKAEFVGDSVYPLAGLPIPTPPGVIPPPGEPYGFKVSLASNGDLTITWKADNPAGAQGTTYRVYRSIAGGPSTYLAGVGGRKFIDTTIPGGATQVTYAIQGVRSTTVGPWGNFAVQFGTNAGGEQTASITSAAPKLAA